MYIAELFAMIIFFSKIDEILSFRNPILSVTAAKPGRLAGSYLIFAVNGLHNVSERFLHCHRHASFLTAVRNRERFEVMGFVKTTFSPLPHLPTSCSSK
jgi:hypothetical protein